MAKLLQHISSLSMLLPVIAFIIGKVRYRRDFNLSFFLFVLYFAVAFMMQVIISVLFFFRTNNILLIKAYLILELPLLSLFLLSLFLGKNAINIKVIIFFTIIPILSNAFFYDLQTVPYEAVVINCLILSILSIVTIRKVNLLNDRLKNEWYYYIILGIVVYSANNSIVFGFTSLGVYFAYNLHAVLTVLQNLLFMIGVRVYYSDVSLKTNL